MEPGDLTGAILDGRYRVIEPIAEGAMGVVYRAERIKLGRIVAIKVLHDELPAELSSRKRFENEAMAMAKLEHPHCAAVLDVGVHDDKPFVVMDFVSGSNLRDIIADGPVPIPRAVEILRQVLSGLAHAHEHGIIHRDIKPANIVLSQKSGLGDHVKILDFGLARLDTDSRITTGIVVGTPSYMAPEQIRGVGVDQRADVYACGVLLFELLTGKKPFVSEKDDPIEVCSMHLKLKPPALAEVQPGIEFGALEGIVARALAKTPDDRYATAVAFATALEVIPTRRSVPVIAAATPIAPATATASETGWAVPPDARSSMFPADAAPVAPSAPVAQPSPPSGPTNAPVAPPPPNGPTDPPIAQPYPPSGPTSAPVDQPLFALPASAPLAKPFPASAPIDQPLFALPASAPIAQPLFALPASAPLAQPLVVQPASAPIAQPSMSAMSPPASTPVASLPIEPAPPRQGLPTNFDLSLAIPQESVATAKGLSPGFDLSLAIPQAATPILERSGEAVAANPDSAASPETTMTPADGSAAAPGHSSGQSSVPGEPSPVERPSNRATIVGVVGAQGPAVTPATDADTVPSGPPPLADNRATVAFLGAAPAGPSPLAARDLPAVAEPVAVHAPPKLPLTTKQIKIGAAALLGLVVVIAIVASSGGSKSTTPVAAIDAAVVAPPHNNPADDEVARANEMIAAGRTDAALEQLLSARRGFPKDARLAYLAGKIYFDRQWWSIGLKQFRDVLALDPTYRSDPELIKIVLKAFITPAEYHAELGTFLRTDIGPPARQYLEETATTHPRAATRARAQAELQRMR